MSPPPPYPPRFIDGAADTRHDAIMATAMLLTPLVVICYAPLPPQHWRTRAAMRLAVRYAAPPPQY